MPEREPLDVLTRVGGYYVSPIKKEKSVGPLVAYAGTYEDGNGKLKQFVGFEYFNFAKVEEDPYELNFFSEILAKRIYSESNLRPTLILGAAMGGIALAVNLSFLLMCRFAFTEKKVLALASIESGKKEVSEIIVDRHKIRRGDKVLLVEDVCNNFSTTSKIKELIDAKGAQLIGITCAVNRSGVAYWKSIPIFFAIYKTTVQFKQDKPEIAKLIKQGKIFWKPKQEWSKLLAKMK